MKVFVLILLYWSTTGGDRAAMISHEYSSLENCEAAAALSRKSFDGWAGRNVYHVCSEK